MKAKILFIEDDLAFGTMLEKWLNRNGYEAYLCSSIRVAKQEIGERNYDLILCDLRLPDGDGVLFLQWLRDKNIRIPFMIVTGYAEIRSAVDAMRFGAEDYLEKPIVPDVFREKIRLALAKSSLGKEPHNPVNPERQNRPDVIVGKSPLARQMHDYIRKVAPTRMSVLILGESGTGKEYVAKMIHHYSQRSNRPFIAVDCGSLSKELAPSELFGHLKGSFTSAMGDKTGVFEQACGGTVFLDEVGNLSYEVQVQLLRALQEQKVRPVGSAQDHPIDIRIIAATHENLNQAIEGGSFREDLYHRLNEFTIWVPSLRERGADLKIFANAFLNQANVELDKQVKGFSPEAFSKLEKYHWGGNLRELRNVVRRAVLFTSAEEITPGDLPVLQDRTVEEPLLYHSNEKERIEEALCRTNGNKSLAAQLLKIDRKTLYNRMHLYGIRLR